LLSSALFILTRPIALCMLRRASQYCIEDSCLRQMSRRASRAYLFLQVSVRVFGAVAVAHLHIKTKAASGDRVQTELSGYFRQGTMKSVKQLVAATFE
jgi:hypothetical protein